MTKAKPYLSDYFIQVVSYLMFTTYSLQPMP